MLMVPPVTGIMVTGGASIVRSPPPAPRPRRQLRARRARRQQRPLAARRGWRGLRVGRGRRWGRGLECPEPAPSHGPGGFRRRSPAKDAPALGFFHLRLAYRTTSLSQGGGALEHATGEVVECPSLELFKTHLDMCLCHLLWVTLPQQGCWTGLSPKVPSSCNDSVILYFCLLF